jgi:hypothetical protein
MQLSTTILLVSIIFIEVENHIYIYHTDDSPSTEYYDCLYVKSFYYCIRPKLPIELRRNDQIETFCIENGGQLYNFSELHKKNISANEIVHKWQSTIERAEEYARYKKNPNESNDKFICQCQNKESFGKFCEYRLPVMNISLQDLLDWQISTRKGNEWDVQMFGTLVCYEGLSCNSGLLCLDWREVCDGIQNCVGGVDEDHCDLLEMNQCDVNEYRCMNGMCIPEVYFLDGEIDCLDWSDEIRIKSSEDCSYESASNVCDDHICYPNQWSCGDGQCISDRLAFQRLGRDKSCVNRRDQYFLCETHLIDTLWTMSNGRCIGDPNYKVNTTFNDTKSRCEHFLRCALSQFGGEACGCGRDSGNCTNVFMKNCSLNETEYPSGRIIAPYISLIFKTQRNSTKFTPDFFQINGIGRCRGWSVNVTNIRMPFDSNFTSRNVFESEFCRGYQNRSNQQCYRSNESTDICQESNPCMSKTRLADGWNNCLKKTDEFNQRCFDVSRHRFRCSTKQSMCVSVTTFGNSVDDCENGYDEFWFGGNRRLSDFNCNSFQNDECQTLRGYIEQSWSNSTPTNETSVNAQIPFRSYCDTFWNLKSKDDEDLSQCRQFWVCAEGQWQCRTGQCIDPAWISDRERDCADGSDEELAYANLTKWIQTAHSQPSDYFSSSCYFPSTFMCLSPSNIEQKFSCVNLSQVGDGKTDCLGAIDERNTLPRCDDSSRMLGNHFRCSSTNQCVPHFSHCKTKQCENSSDDERWCSRSNSPSNCNEINDFVCFDGKCVQDGRCDKKIQCPAGEDEFMCDFPSRNDKRVVPYRRDKEISTKNRIRHVHLLSFPNQSNKTRTHRTDSTSKQNLNFSSENSSLTAFWCNRGLGILLSNSSIICFCPAQYYGDRCQYQTHRLLLLFHLQYDRTVSYDLQYVIKFLVLFLFDDKVFITHEFHIRPAMDLNTNSKKRLNLIYSRQEKQTFNRTETLRSPRYSIKIEAYELRSSSVDISLISVWRFPILFNFLPVFRLAKVLNLIRSTSNSKISSQNQNCSTDFCAAGSICKPNSRGISRQPSTPYCICQSDRYGDRCELENDRCQSNPCLNGGTCLPTSYPDRFLCLCHSSFHGTNCTQRKSHLRLTFGQVPQYKSIVVQYFDLNVSTSELILIRQEVFTQLPPALNFFHESKTIPDVVLARVYSSFDVATADIHLLLSQINVTSLDDQTEISDRNRCEKLENVSSPIEFHQFCSNESEILCFRSDFYLCICSETRRHAECFRYDENFDRCSFCLAGGRCLRGDSTRSDDFVCLCPSCHSGRRCQFDSNSFAFTLDQLLHLDLISDENFVVTSILLVLVLLTFLLGLPNNFFCFLTFKRRVCLRNGVAHYLLFLSPINQLNLGLFVLRLFHLIWISKTKNSNFIFNEIFCRSLNFLFISTSRLVYWFSSLIAIERIYITLVFNGRWFKNLRNPRRLIFVTISTVFISNFYQIFFFKFFNDFDRNGSSICIFEYPQHYRNFWTKFHLIITISHWAIPFLINYSRRSQFVLSF